MPIRITDLAVGKRTFDIPFGESSLKLTYDPNQITVEQEAMAIELQSQGRRVQALANSLASLIVEWDLTDEKGKTLPVSKEAIQGLGWPVMLYLNRQIIEDFYPDPLAGLSSPSS